jgi:ATP-dependent Clp protease ATP-binding subunit ClpA
MPEEIATRPEEQVAERFYPTEPLDKDSVLAKVGEDMTLAAKDEDPGEAAGREPQLEQLIRTLGRRTKANPVILGDAGVGKTFLVRLLARRIVERKVPAWLEGRKVIRTSYYDIQAALPNADWMWPQYMKMMRDLLRAAASLPVVLFLDEIHQMFGYPHSTNVLKPYLAGGKIKLVGATTTAEFHRFLAREEAIARRFQPVVVPPPAGAVLEGIAGAECRDLKRHYGLAVDPAVTRVAITLADEYLPFRSQPDKTIDLLEGAFVLAGAAGRSTVGADDVRDAAAELTGIPGAGRAASGAGRDALEAELNRRVLGQEEVIAAICRRLFVTRNRVQLNRERPLGVFLCTGPSGVGKTELAKALAGVYAGSEEHLVRVDMSVHQSLVSLLGRPGPANPENPANLPPFSLELRRHPHGVLLLDEFEKADEEVWMAFLQAFDYGRLTDLQGNVLHLGSYVVLMTCNVGFDKREEWTRVRGFAPASDEDSQSRAGDFLKATGLKFPAEFIGRLDGVLVFNLLTDAVMDGFIDQKIARLGELTGKCIRVEEEVRALVRERGFHPLYGARTLNGAFDEVVGTALAELRMTAAWDGAATVRVRLADGAPRAEAVA